MWTCIPIATHWYSYVLWTMDITTKHLGQFLTVASPTFKELYISWGFSFNGATYAIMFLLQDGSESNSQLTHSNRSFTFC